MTTRILRIETIELGDESLLQRWADGFRPYWAHNIYPELLRTEYRICAYVPEMNIPAAFASVTPTNSIDGVDDGALWFDHLLVDERVRGRGLVKDLYAERLVYARRFPQRRILSVPINPIVEAFFRCRGWRWCRDTRKDGASYPVYELPREIMS